MSEAPKKILFYYRHSGRPGQGVRIAALCRELAQRPSCQILFVNGGRKHPEPGIAQYATVFDLPVFGRRREILKKLCAGFRPDVAVIEEMISGEGRGTGDAALLIEALQKEGCVCYLSVRDITGRSADGARLVPYAGLVNGILVYSAKDRAVLIRSAGLRVWKEKVFVADVPRAAAHVIRMACHLRSLQVHLVSECNLHCDMCNWDEKEAYPPFPREAFQRLVLRSKIVGIQEIHLIGGEVTLLPDIRGIFQYIRDNGLRVALTTNGYVAPAKWATLAPLIDAVQISLDSHDPAAHDRIRGRVGAFERTLGTIRSLTGYKMSRRVNVTVRPDNYVGLYQIIQLLEGQVDFVSFNLVDMGDDAEKRFVFSDDQLRGFYFKEVPLILRECLKSKLRVSIDPFFQELTGRDPGQMLHSWLARKREYSERLRSLFSLENVRCRFTERLQVDASGQIFCCGFPKEIKAPLGNVLTHDLCDILVSDSYTDFVNNISPGKGLCRMCKGFFVMNYGAS